MHAVGPVGFAWPRGTDVAKLGVPTFARLASLISNLYSIARAPLSTARGDRPHSRERRSVARDAWQKQKRVYI